jgi:hypothetical protein
MEMPEDCFECPFGIIDDTEDGVWCNALAQQSSGQREDCPILCQLPEGHGRLVDADAYSAEMKDRQDAAWKWRNEAIAEEDEVKLARAEGAFTAFVEAKLTWDKQATIVPADTAERSET